MSDEQKWIDPNITIKKIICYGHMHELDRSVIPLKISKPHRNDKYVLPYVALPALLNCIGRLRRFKDEIIWVEDSLTSWKAFFEL